MGRQPTSVAKRKPDCKLKTRTVLKRPLQNRRCHRCLTLAAPGNADLQIGSVSRVCGNGMQLRGGRHGRNTLFHTGKSTQVDIRGAVEADVQTIKRVRAPGGRQGSC